MYGYLYDPSLVRISRGAMESWIGSGFWSAPFGRDSLRCSFFFFFFYQHLSSTLFPGLGSLFSSVSKVAILLPFPSAFFFWLHICERRFCLVIIFAGYGTEERVLLGWSSGTFLYQNLFLHLSSSVGICDALHFRFVRTVLVLYGETTMCNNYPR
ncbi:uncharacterized protein BO88DRAFT_214027 [Aspergillus vadensis CBS 113365]|uniref:Uncharacterized protein n=1 Tax=Aspergillus vadensis (strain CBS 113365 / IMI 142717 / IBT 24658) TaxID=1448311 RepID=A0A319BJI5_ASPVC|nr:hypothetical protein BO88DRAFT_214027 [Aspergillus vadensis CBS 113365]PYH72414.1 hypothetical protein BO88DRAFT_214027 [Aspergillus vadensis CBS 113365]